MRRDRKSMRSSRAATCFVIAPTWISTVAKLEREFAEFMGVPFALAVSSCSSALFLSLKALDIGPGDKVLVPAFTFAAVPSAVVHAGGAGPRRSRRELSDRPERFCSEALGRREGRDRQPHARPHLRYGRDHGSLRRTECPGGRGCGSIPSAPFGQAEKSEQSAKSDASRSNPTS